MKTAIYIEDGTLQLILTPETDFEKSSLKTLISRKVAAQIFEGTFYGCAGGWIRQSRSWGGRLDDTSVDSLIIRADNAPEPAKTEAPTPQCTCTFASGGEGAAAWATQQTDVNCPIHGVHLVRA